jgi:release factor glutamine methyltransferase
LDNINTNKDFRFVEAQVQSALASVYSAGENKVIAKAIAEDLWGTSLITLIGREYYLDATQEKKLNTQITRLKTGEPLQYVLGYGYFGKHKLIVDKRALIPRPETEELCAYVVNCVFECNYTSLKILDIGTGSGCIPIYLKDELPQAIVSAIDVSTEALELAKLNAKNSAMEIEFIKADILNIEVLPDNYDIIVSNPPYVLKNEQANMERNVLAFEPHLALFVPDYDGAKFYDKISKLAAQHLNVGGFLYYEINPLRAQEVLDGMTACGLVECKIIKDLIGLERFAVGRKPFIGKKT